MLSHNPEVNARNSATQSGREAGLVLPWIVALQSAEVSAVASCLTSILPFKAVAAFCLTNTESAGAGALIQGDSRTSADEEEDEPAVDSALHGFAFCSVIFDTKQDLASALD